MINNKRPWIVLVFVTLFLGLTPILWFKPNKIITGTDVDFALSPKDRFFERIYAWYPSILGGTDRSNNFTSIPFMTPPYVLTTLGFGLEASEMITYVFWFSLTGLSMLFLAYVIFSFRTVFDQIASFFSVVMYMFNFYNIFLWQRLQSNITSLIIFPIFMGLIILIHRKEVTTIKASLFLFIASILSSSTGIQPPLLQILFLSLFLLILFLLYSSTDIFTEKIKFIFKVILLALVYILSSFFWLLPLIHFVTNSGFLDSSHGKTVYDVDNLLGWVSSSTGFQNIFRLQGDAPWYSSWGGEQYFQDFVIFKNNVILILASFFTPVLFIITLLSKKTKQKNLILYFEIITLLGLFLSKGIHPPFDSVYRWLMKNIPTFWIHRAPWQKFSFMTVIGYSIVTGYALKLIIHKISFLGKKTRNIILSSTCLILLFIISYNYLFTLGKMFSEGKGDKGYHEKFKLGFQHTIPEYLYQSREYINNQLEDFRLFLLPDDRTSVYSWGYAGSTDMSNYLFNKGTLQRQWGEGYAPPNSEEALQTQIVDYLYGTSSGKISPVLGLLNVKFILQRNDFRFDFYGDTDSPEFIKEKIKINTDWSIEKSIGKWDFYRVPEKYILPKIYLSNKEKIIENSIFDSFAEIKNYSAEDRYSFFYKKDKPILDSAPAMAKISFLKINPIKYVIKIDNIKSYTNIIFSESFNNGWKLYPVNEHSFNQSQLLAKYFSGEVQEYKPLNVFFNNYIFENIFNKFIPDEYHKQVNVYANSWLVDPLTICTEFTKGCIYNDDGSFTLSLAIEFWPQRLFYLGIMITLSTLLVLLICLCLSRHLFHFKRINSFTKKNV